MANSILILMFAHFVADFIAQSDMMAQNKSKSWYWLFYHVGVYTIVITPAAFVLLGLDCFIWLMLNFALHFVTDAVTSRGTAYLYTRSRHWFFVLIGFDQYIHLVCIVKTYEYMR